jgi:hypothetical protein
MKCGFSGKFCAFLCLIIYFYLLCIINEFNFLSHLLRINYYKTNSVAPPQKLKLRTFIYMDDDTNLLFLFI